MNSSQAIDRIEDAKTITDLENIVNGYILSTGCAMPGKLESKNQLAAMVSSMVRCNDFESAKVFAEAEHIFDEVLEGSQDNDDFFAQ